MTLNGAHGPHVARGPDVSQAWDSSYSFAQNTEMKIWDQAQLKHVKLAIKIHVKCS